MFKKLFVFICLVQFNIFSQQVEDFYEKISINNRSRIEGINYHLTKKEMKIFLKRGKNNTYTIDSNFNVFSEKLSRREARLVYGINLGFIKNGFYFDDDENFNPSYNEKFYFNNSLYRSEIFNGIKKYRKKANRQEYSFFTDSLDRTYIYGANLDEILLPRIGSIGYLEDLKFIEKQKLNELEIPLTNNLQNFEKKLISDTNLILASYLNLDSTVFGHYINSSLKAGYIFKEKNGDINYIPNDSITVFTIGRFDDEAFRDIIIDLNINHTGRIESYNKNAFRIKFAEGLIGDYSGWSLSNPMKYMLLEKRKFGDNYIFVFGAKTVGTDLYTFEGENGSETVEVAIANNHGYKFVLCDSNYKVLNFQEFKNNGAGCAQTYLISENNIAVIFKSFEATPSFFGNETVIKNHVLDLSLNIRRTFNILNNKEYIDHEFGFKKYDNNLLIMHNGKQKIILKLK